MTAARDIFELPPYHVGIYTVTVRPLTDRRPGGPKTAGVFAQEPVCIATDIPVGEQVLLYVRQLVHAIHYRNGAVETADEENMTTGLASGLVEVAARNPEWWARFNGFLARHAFRVKHSGWESIARGRSARQPAPHRVVVREHVYTFEVLKRDKSAYGVCYMSPDRRQIAISPNIEGLQLPTVVLHEVLHAVHEAEGLDEPGLRAVHFRRRQARALLRFIGHNPRFWRWWLELVYESARDCNFTKESS
jgi:hypothetical protein